MAGIVGRPRSYFRKFNFILEISGFTGLGGGKVGFQKCSAIAYEAKKMEHWEGGATIPVKVPSGRLEFPDVTLDRGATKDTDAYNWMLEVGDAAAQVGLVDDQYKRDVAVIQLDRDGSELKRWSLFRAWPMKFQAGEWDNTSDDPVIEQLVLCYDYFVPA
jgi:phage tail-like protein